MAGTSKDPSKRIPAMFQWLDAQGTKPPHVLASERAATELAAAAVERAEAVSRMEALAETARAEADQKAAEQEVQVDRSENLARRMTAADVSLGDSVESMRTKVAEAETLNARLEELKTAALAIVEATPDAADAATDIPG